MLAVQQFLQVLLVNHVHAYVHVFYSTMSCKQSGCGPDITNTHLTYICEIWLHAQMAINHECDYLGIAILATNATLSPSLPMFVTLTGHSVLHSRYTI